MKDFAQKVASDRLTKKQLAETKRKHQEIVSLVGEVLNSSLTNSARLHKVNKETLSKLTEAQKSATLKRSDLEGLYDLVQELNLTMFTMFMAQYESLERIIEALYNSNRDE